MDSQHSKDTESYGGNTNAAAHRARWRKVILSKIEKGLDLHVWKRRAAFYKGRRYDGPCPHGIAELLVQDGVLQPLRPTFDQLGFIYGLGTVPYVPELVIDDEDDDEDEGVDTSAYGLAEEADEESTDDTDDDDNELEHEEV